MLAVPRDYATTRRDDSLAALSENLAFIRYTSRSSIGQVIQRHLTRRRVAPPRRLEFDSSAVSWTSSTFSSVRGGLIYADALAGNNGIAAINFGADYSVTSGTLSVTPASCIASSAPVIASGTVSMMTRGPRKLSNCADSTR